MLRTTAIAKELAAIERKMQETDNATLKEALKKKQARLKAELKDPGQSATKLAKTLLAQREVVKQLSKVEFNDLIRRLSKKPEYSFLKTMPKSTVKNDLEVTAKPVGWRFKGRGNYDKPTKAEIIKGKKNGTVYREVRPRRSDVSQVVKLAEGGGVDSIEPTGYKQNDAVEYGKKLIDAGVKYSVVRSKIEEHYASLRGEIQDVMNKVLDYKESKMSDGGSMYAGGGKVVGSDVYAYFDNNYMGYQLVESPALGEPYDGKITDIITENGKKKYVIKFENGETKKISESIFDNYIYLQKMSDGGSIYADGGKVDENWSSEIKVGDEIYARWNETMQWTLGTFIGETENGFEVYDFTIKRPDHIEFYAQISKQPYPYGREKVFTSKKFKDRNYDNYHFNKYTDDGSMYADGGGVDMNKKILSYLKSMQTSEAKKILAKYDKIREEQGYYGQRPAIYVFTIDNILFDGKKYSARVKQTYTYPNFIRIYGEMPSIWELDLRTERHKDDIASFVFTEDKWNEVSKKLQSSMYADGGSLEKESVEMINNQATSAKHHIEELKQVLSHQKEIEPWVIAKMQRATTDLADITHYLDGKDPKMAFGGVVYDLSNDAIDRMDGLVPIDAMQSLRNSVLEISRSFEEEGFEKEEIASYLSYMIVSHLNKMMAKGGNIEVGDTIRLKTDLPYMASLSSLMGKDLEVVDVKEVYFASGPKKFYHVMFDGDKHEINEDFFDHGNKMMTGGSIEVGDKVKATKEYGGKSGKVVEKRGSFVVVEDSKGNTESYHESDLVKKMAQGGQLTAAQQKKFDQVMHEWGQGKLHSGSEDGPIVKDQDQAVAIAYAEARGMKKMAKGGYLEGREEFEGFKYQIYYSPTKGMYSVSDNEGIFKGDNNYFKKYDEAKEHAEISISSMLSDKDEMAKGGGVDKYDALVEEQRKLIDQLDNTSPSDRMYDYLRKKIQSLDKRIEKMESSKMAKGGGVGKYKIAYAGKGFYGITNGGEIIGEYSKEEAQKEANKRNSKMATGSSMGWKHKMK